MLFFLICADEELARAECRARGWVQAGITRFYTPERNDVRLVRRWVDFALLPGGTWFMAAADFHQNPHAEDFLQLVTGGQAKWIPGEEPKEPPESVEPPDPPEHNQSQAMAELQERETLRERYKAELLRRQSSGGRPGRPPLQR